MIRSIFLLKSLIWFIFMLILALFGLIFYVCEPIVNNDVGRDDWLFILFFSCLVFFIIYLIKEFKFLIIDTRNEKHFFYFRSIFHPFGKTLYFKDYTGIYKTTESGSGGTYEVVYLVDHNNITQFKIMGLYYKNKDEIIAAIPLPEIKRNLSGKEYLKLMFTGRANLSKIKDKKNTDSKIAFYFKVFSAVTILIFVIGMLVRVFSR